jgi:hypothetical protein
MLVDTAFANAPCLTPLLSKNNRDADWLICDAQPPLSGYLIRNA